MATKKLLIEFDSKKPDDRSTDFLVVVLEKTEAKLVGIKSKKSITTGLMVYLGKEITANDLLAKLVAMGWRIESVEQTLHSLEHYVEKLQEFRIGNLLSVESDSVDGFKLMKLADVPPSTSIRKLP